jgi:DNA-binding winged helix-turn-helix (wHTH) protein/tetratricopeptide (TPR) repeat protein
MPSEEFKFEDFSLDSVDEILSKKGISLQISRRSFQVLQLLVENAGNIVRKEDFFAKVWEGNAVEENNLTVAIAQVRKILGETKDNKFIETLPLKGYRFVAEVELQADRTQASASLVSNKSTKENFLKRIYAQIAMRKVLFGMVILFLVFSLAVFWQSTAKKPRLETYSSIAVLPFSIDKQSPDNEIFTEKLTQELIQNLGKITELRVSSYAAVANYTSPNIDITKFGNDLQVDAVVSGKISNKNDSAGELTIEITDLKSGESIFTSNYSLSQKDLPESQFLIARDIAQKFGKSQTPENEIKTQNLEAYQAYLLARHHLSKRSTEDFEKAIQNFSAAIVKDESFAEGFAGLASAHIQHGLSLYANRGLSASRKSFPAAKEAANKALVLNKNSDEALAVLGFASYRQDFDWINAETNFRKAIEINPNNIQAHRWFGEFLHCLGRFDEGFAEQQKALRIEPNSAKILSEIAWGNYLARRFDEAENYAQKSYFIDKNNATTLYNLSEIHENKGNHREAVALWKDAMVIESSARKWVANLEKSFEKDGYSGFVRAKSDWMEDLIEKDYVYPTDLAKCYAAMNEKDAAIKWLTKAVEGRVPDISSVKFIPVFDKLKDDARFQALLKQMNFP